MATVTFEMIASSADTITVQASLNGVPLKTAVMPNLPDIRTIHSRTEDVVEQLLIAMGMVLGGSDSAAMMNSVTITI